MITMDQKDVNQLFKRLDQIEAGQRVILEKFGSLASEEGQKVILRKLESIANNINQVDKDLQILDSFHLDHTKIHGELQSNTDHLNVVIDKVKDNTKITEAVGEVNNEILEKVEKIEEQNGSTE